jgi:hypothetical protein
MRRLALVSLFVSLLLSLVACGGQLGHNSPTQVRLESTVRTGDLSMIHVIISPNNGSAVNINAVSDIQPQPWATILTGAGFKEIDFTTTSQQVPYFLYLQNTSLVEEEVRLRILMDGNQKYDQIVTIAADTTVQQQTIFRNHVQNP